MKTIIANVAMCLLLAGMFALGFSVSEHSKPKIQLIRGVDCELPEKLETLVLAVARNDGDTALLYSCTTVSRGTRKPQIKQSGKRIDPS